MTAVGKAAAARKLASAAAYGGGGLSVLGAGLYGLLRTEATLARKTIGTLRAAPPPDPTGWYGRGRPGPALKIALLGDSSAAGYGVDRVVEALRKGQVETLVLADDWDDEELLVGGSPLELGVRQQDMDALGSHGTAVPAERALVHAAVASAADVVALPRSAMPDGVPVAAVLRYTDDSTSSGQ